MGILYRENIVEQSSCHSSEYCTKEHMSFADRYIYLQRFSKLYLIVTNSIEKTRVVYF